MQKQQIPLAIYLDLNKWVDLSLAYHSRPGGEPYLELLQRIIRLVEDNKVILPLSATHLIETRKSRNTERRKRLASVLSLLSKGITIAPQDRMARWEILKSLSVIFEKPVPEIPSAFGIGIPFAFGLTQKVYEKSSGRPVNIDKQFRQQVDSFLASRKIVEMFLADESNESQNLKTVQQYEASSAEFIHKVEKFRSDVKEFDKTAHKRAYAAVLMAAIYPELSKELAIYGITFNKFLGLGQDKLLAFFESVPTLDVEIELVVERNENWSRKIHKNDKADISFLSVAIPYCDIVVCEHFFTMSAINRKLDKKYNTIILEKLTDLSTLLP
jgi:hypothetical protein